MEQGRAISLEDLDAKLPQLNPQPVKYFTPDNLQEVMEDFLSGKNRNPTNAIYLKLDSINFLERDKEYEAVLDEISSSELPPSYRPVYENYVKQCQRLNRLMEAAVGYRTSSDPDEKTSYKEKFMTLNKELYGLPDQSLAGQMAIEILDDTADTTDPKVRKIRSEFENMVFGKIQKPKSKINLKTNEELIIFTKNMVDILYASLFKHADDGIRLLRDEENKQEPDLKIGPQAIAVVFQNILDNEFPNSGWKVIIKPSNAINVVASDKNIVVPERKTPVGANKLKGLVVHEIGVHAVRAMIGAKADMTPLQYGFSGYLEAEEGIANVLESAVNTDGKQRTGYQHYLVATMISNGFDFRDVHEVMWRYKVLDRHLERPEKPITKKFIDHEKREAFIFSFRSIRGTNELPWFMTLNYYNGTRKIWEFIDRYKDDPDLMVRMFMGKTDPTEIGHFKSALEAKGRVS